MEKTILIDEKEVRFKATALTPRIYREKFGRDLLLDLEQLREAMRRVATGGSDEQFSVADLTVFENVAFTMARQADQNIPQSVDEWLDGFGMFSIYSILPEIISLWQQNTTTTATAKKK